jgi:hypothetical protein
MFYTFTSQEERRRVGGSCFIEFQFCKLPIDTKINKIVSVDSINNWLNDSLYVSDENYFYEEYNNIFDYGIYSNLERGIVDIYGINYYPPELIEVIINKILKETPSDYKKLVEWLEKAKAYNGFYILGI